MKSEHAFFDIIDISDRPLQKSQIELKKAKIVCTIGPSSEKIETLRKMIRAGMNVARLNFSHGTHEDHQKRMASIREAAAKEKKFVAILQDIQGPKLRVGKFESGEITLKKDQKFTITTKVVKGTEKIVSCTYRLLHKDVQKGHRILLDDGLLLLQVTAVRGQNVETKVIFGGVLKNNKGINLPDTLLSMSCLTSKDKKDLEFGVAHGVDFIALSFISRAEDIHSARRLLKKHRFQVPLIAKIETQNAVANLDEITEAADGLMVARGDLGVECPLEQVPGLQKRIIRSANRSGRFVITATQMLESMVWAPRPTRAEASDVANAVLDGTDAVMLSAETATGRYPVETVATMSRVIARTEEYEETLSDIQFHRMNEQVKTIGEAITASAVQSTNSLDVSALVAFTHSGRTARLISRFRPRPPIVALSPFDKICRQLCIVWGVVPAKTSGLEHTDDMLKLSKAPLSKHGLWKKGRKLVILSGTPVAQPGSTNLLKVLEIQ